MHKKYIDIDTIDFKPKRNTTLPLYQQIIDYIKMKVAKGDWLVNDILPSQRALSLKFGINRSTLIYALEELYSIGILESTPQKEIRILSNTWSLLFNEESLNWKTYVMAGEFKANIPTIQAINKLEFADYYRLSTGELAPKLFPKEIFNSITLKLSDKISSLNYLEPLGLLELREELVKHLAKKDIHTNSNCILITSGSLQALQLISIAMIKPDSKVYTEAPTYLKSLQVFQSAKVKLEGIPMDEEGIKYWQINTKNLDSDLLYLIPDFHNPTGINTSLARRKEILQYANSNRIPIIEDSAYTDLYIDEKPPLSLKALDDNNQVLYLGSASKALAPGLRVGWIVGPQSIIERLGDVKMQIDYGASSISQWIMYEFLKSGAYEKHLLELRLELKQRRDEITNFLDLHYHDIAKYTFPTGGFYVYLDFFKKIDIDLLFKKALKEKILINPGNVYDYNENNAIRISYVYEDIATLKMILLKLLAIINDTYKKQDNL